MNERKRLYAWDADRDPRNVCIEYAPFDDDGQPLLLFNSMELSDDVTINLELPRRGRLTDFLYSLNLKLFVSDRVREVLSRAHVPSLRIHDVVLRDRKGRAVDDSTYSWINVMPIVKLVDRERSTFVEWDREIGGGIRSVSRLVIREEAIPDDEVFLLDELSLPVFSARLVRELEAIGATGAVWEDLDGLRWPV